MFELMESLLLTYGNKIKNKHVSEYSCLFTYEDEEINRTINFYVTNREDETKIEFILSFNPKDPKRDKIIASKICIFIEEELLKQYRHNNEMRMKIISGAYKIEKGEEYIRDLNEYMEDVTFKNLIKEKLRYQKKLKPLIILAVIANLLAVLYNLFLVVNTESVLQMISGITFIFFNLLAVIVVLLSPVLYFAKERYKDIKYIKKIKRAI